MLFSYFIWKERVWNDEKMAGDMLSLYIAGSPSAAFGSDFITGQSGEVDALCWCHRCDLRIKISSDGNNSIGGAMKYEEKRKE